MLATAQSCQLARVAWREWWEGCRWPCAAAEPRWGRLAPCLRLRGASAGSHLRRKLSLLAPLRTAKAALPGNPTAARPLWRPAPAPAPPRYPATQLQSTGLPLCLTRRLCTAFAFWSSRNGALRGLLGHPLPWHDRGAGMNALQRPGHTAALSLLTLPPLRRCAGCAHVRW